MYRINCVIIQLKTYKLMHVYCLILSLVCPIKNLELYLFFFKKNQRQTVLI